MSEIKMWKYLSFFVLVPIGACFINAHKLEKEVEEQFEHNRPEFVPYEHLRIRKKVIFICHFRIQRSV